MKLMKARRARTHFYHSYVTKELPLRHKMQEKGKAKSLFGETT